MISSEFKLMLAELKSITEKSPPNKRWNVIGSFLTSVGGWQKLKCLLKLPLCDLNSSWQVNRRLISSNKKTINNFLWNFLWIVLCYCSVKYFQKGNYLNDSLICILWPFLYKKIYDYLWPIRTTVWLTILDALTVRKQFIGHMTLVSYLFVFGKFYFFSW